MNIFIIPSWYPSQDSPQAGIFFKEQAVALATAYPDSCFAISTWGQNEEGLLLWARDHLKNFEKIFKFFLKDSSIKRYAPNLVENYSPSLTWSRKFLNGNLKNILKVNENHLLSFADEVEKVDIIHAHVAFPAGFIAMQLAKKHKIPYIITEHMGPFPMPAFPSRKGEIQPIIKEPLKHAKAVISVSPSAADDIQHKTAIQPMVIPNLVDENFFFPRVVKSLPIGFIFFTLCNIAPQKGIPDLLKAIALLENKTANFRLGGDGEHKREYQQLAEELKISPRISWLGELGRQEAAQEFQKCNAFVLPSIHESMGVVYAEAIACGKPIIATRCGGPEFIVKGHNGLLVDVNAPEQLAQAMDYMIENYERFHPDIIRQDFMERFSSDVITRKIYSVYEAVASKKPLPAELFLNKA